MFEYYCVVLPAKMQLASGPSTFDPAVGQGPNAMVAEHNNYINQLGAQGWELISASPVSVLEGATVGIYMVFKRRKTQ